MLELTSEERKYVVAILKSSHTELLRDLNHADSRDFRRELREVIAMNERITDKVSAETAVAAGAHDWDYQPVRV